MVDNSIYDPCFSIGVKEFVFCQMNPLVEDSFLIESTKDLPEVKVTTENQNNWAWFVKLEDGIYCSPFTGTRPFFGENENAQIAYYGCNSQNKDEQIVLLGDLMRSNIWTAKKAIIVKDGENWVIKSIDNAQIDTVWQ
jgi:hypothetical protein